MIPWILDPISFQTCWNEWVYLCIIVYFKCKSFIYSYKLFYTIISRDYHRIIFTSRFWIQPPETFWPTGQPADLRIPYQFFPKPSRPTGGRNTWGGVPRGFPWQRAVGSLVRHNMQSWWSCCWRSELHQSSATARWWSHQIHGNGDHDFFFKIQVMILEVKNPTMPIAKHKSGDYGQLVHQFGDVSS